MRYNGELRSCNNIDDLKKMFYSFAKVLHPDHGGTKEDFQALNNDYMYMFNIVKNVHIGKGGGTYEKENAEAPQEFVNIINKLINVPGLHIDIVGCFIWIGGNTKDNKELLKSMGFRWSSNKKLWYKSPDGYKKSSRKSFTYEEIINKYGIQSSINTGARKKAASRYKLAY